VFNFYSHISILVSNKTPYNILLEACFDEILLKLFSSGNFIEHNHWSTSFLTNSRLDDCVHMTITLESHTSSFLSFIFQYPLWEEVCFFNYWGLRKIILDLIESS
jgi:hypothetical protein